MVGLAAQMASLSAVQITGYSSSANDRFQGGYPGAPVLNTNLSFVGSGYDWSGVGWASTDATKSFGFLSPLHYLVARHYGGSATINIFGGDGQLHSVTQSSVTDTGHGVVFSGQTVGDLSLGKLASPVSASWDMARYAVLDLNSTSSINTTYNGQPLLVYGRGGNGTQSTRVGAAAVSSTVLSGANSYITTNRTNVQLETGDSGSPTFIGWTNPNGGKELTILGNNAAIDASNNYMNYLGNSVVINQLNAMMTVDGYALRIAGNPSQTWKGNAGGTGSDLARSQNWSGSAVPTDLFALFDASTTTYRAINVNTNTNIRGLYFKATATAGDAFSFSGSSSLTIGRGGLTNYDEAGQAFTSTVVLGDHQYWDVGVGGVTLAGLNTNGKLLEISGEGNATITGQISGSGGIALSGNLLVLSGNSTYTGRTWVHTGVLEVDGDITSSSGVALDAGASISGHGFAGTVSGPGSVDPGNSPGILTVASLDTSSGMDFNFEFTGAESPEYANASASVNDVLRITGAEPFSQSLTDSNTVSVFLNIVSLHFGSTFRGGFFTDNDAAFFDRIESAAFLYYLADPSGLTVYNGVVYSAYGGPLTFELSTIRETASFSSGVKTGYVMQITAVPEPAPMWLVLAGGTVVILLVRSRVSSSKKAWASISSAPTGCPGSPPPS